jgi:hypothetical protein
VVVAYGLVAFVSALFLLLKLYSVNVFVGDEHLYFNMAVLVNEGLIPHRDFFYTHPPLHLYVAALAVWLFGYSLFLVKALPNLSMLVGGLLVFAVAKRALANGVAALACGLFLLSFDPLRISSHFTGGNLAFALSMAGLWFGLLNWAAVGGVFFGLGALVAAYVAPGAAAVALMLLWRSRKLALTFVAAAAAVALAGNLILYVMAGRDFVYQVYLTQFEKGPEGSLIGYALYHRLGYILYENLAMTSGFVAGVVLLAGRVCQSLSGSARNKGLRLRAFQAWVASPQGEFLLLSATWFVLYWIFYNSIRLHHAYYFIFIMPMFAWFSAYSYVEIGRSALRLVRSAAMRSAESGMRNGGRAEWRKETRTAKGAATKSRWPLRLASPLLVGLGLVAPVIVSLQVFYVPYALKRYGTQPRLYNWQPIPYLKQLDPLIQRVFWNPIDDPRDPPWGITAYLQHESIHVTVAEQIYDAVRRHSRPHERIFGEGGLTPLVASETGRRVAANLVDTSTYRLSYGLSKIEDWIAEIEADNVKLMVVRDGVHLMRTPAFRRYVEGTFRTVETLRDPRFGVFKVMRRRTAGSRPEA